VTPALYSASVPVFQHYLDRLEGLVGRVQGQEAMLGARLAPDMFTAGQQIASAVGFTLRISYLLAGLEPPRDSDLGVDRIGLLRRIQVAREGLAGLDPATFAGADTRRIRHRAGFAELDQTAAVFLHLFGMPNFMFHTCMAFAVLRGQGLEIGKADFDGLHDYPHGFRF